MKSINIVLFLTLTCLWMSGCHSSHDHGSMQTESKLNLQLDNGKKWTANPETQAGFEKIEQRLKSFAMQESPALSDYNNLGKELEGIINNVVQQCTMKGQGHEELHKLLVPVIGHIKNCKGDDLRVCQDAVEELERLVGVYFKYFQV